MAAFQSHQDKWRCIPAKHSALYNGIWALLFHFHGISTEIITAHSVAMWTRTWQTLWGDIDHIIIFDSLCLLEMSDTTVARECRFLVECLCLCHFVNKELWEGKATSIAQTYFTTALNVKENSGYVKTLSPEQSKQKARDWGIPESNKTRFAVKLKVTVDSLTGDNWWTLP